MPDRKLVIGDIRTVDLNVKQKPTYVCFDCPSCEEEVEIKYSDFVKKYGDPPDWSYKTIACPYCKFLLEVDEWEYE